MSDISNVTLTVSDLFRTGRISGLYERCSNKYSIKLLSSVLAIAVHRPSLTSSTPPFERLVSFHVAAKGSMD